MFTGPEFVGYAILTLLFIVLGIGCVGHFCLRINDPSAPSSSTSKKSVVDFGNVKEGRPPGVVAAPGETPLKPFRWPPPIPVPEKRKAREAFDAEALQWSRNLWSDAARRTGWISLVLFVFYVALSISVMYADGLTGVDVWYLLFENLTTVGFGDLTPRSQLARLAQLLLLPLGLVVIGFVIATVMASGNSQETALPSVAREQLRLLEERNANIEKNEDGKMDLSEFLMRAQEWGLRFSLTAEYKALVIFAKYVAVIFIGATFFLFDAEERRRQGMESVKAGYDEEKTTVVDCFFFATVVATTVGYGHRIVPHSEGAKLFVTFYMIFAVVVVGGLLGDLSNLVYARKEEDLAATMIDSCTWVHKADLHRRGVVTKVDYILFKLQQMQSVDEGSLTRLTERFTALDTRHKGLLEIGLDVPSAEQVEELEQRAGVDRNDSSAASALNKAWKLRQSRLRKVRRSSFSGSTDGGSFAHGEEYVKQKAAAKAKAVAESPIRLSECHNFSWSRNLWNDAAHVMLENFVVLFLVYFLVGYYLLCKPQGVTGAAAFYMLSATLFTVGYGDVAPREQHTRGFALVLIPFALCVLGFAFSAAAAKANGRAKPLMDAEKLRACETAALFEAIDVDGNGELTKDEVVAARELLDMTKEVAGKFFDDLDVKGQGFINTPSEPPTLWLETIAGRLVILFTKVYAFVLVGAMWYYWVQPLENLGQWDGASAGDSVTFIDALYFAVATATGIGYGDIVPKTPGGQWFCTFYMAVSTYVVGNALGELVDVYVRDVVGEAIVSEIIESDIWVHKADTNGDGDLTEAEYVLFKLQQMQMVDPIMLDRLLTRYDELDKDGSGSLDIGIEVPAPHHIPILEERVKLNPKLSLNDAWRLYVEARGKRESHAEEVREVADKAKDSMRKGVLGGVFGATKQGHAEMAENEAWHLPRVGAGASKSKKAAAASPGKGGNKKKQQTPPADPSTRPTDAKPQPPLAAVVEEKKDEPPLSKSSSSSSSGAHGSRPGASSSARTSSATQLLPGFLDEQEAPTATVAPPAPPAAPAAAGLPAGAATAPAAAAAPAAVVAAVPPSRSNSSSRSSEGSKEKEGDGANDRGLPPGGTLRGIEKAYGASPARKKKPTPQNSARRTSKGNVSSGPSSGRSSRPSSKEKALEGEKKTKLPLSTPPAATTSDVASTTTRSPLAAAAKPVTPPPREKGRFTEETGAKGAGEDAKPGANEKLV